MNAINRIHAALACREHRCPRPECSNGRCKSALAFSEDCDACARIVVFAAMPEAPSEEALAAYLRQTPNRSEGAAELALRAAYRAEREAVE